MTDLRKAAEMALAALEPITSENIESALIAAKNARYFLRQALAQGEQEPVAWVRDLTSPQPHCVTSLKYRSVADTDAGVKYIPVYVAPPSKPWVSLTDKEIIDGYCKQADGTEWAIGGLKDAMPFARAIEAALRSKNT